MRLVAPRAILALACLLLFATLSLAEEAAQRQPLPQGVQRPVQVHLVVRILDVLKINETTGEAQIAVEVQQRWRDPTQSFDPIAFGRDRQDFAGGEASSKLASIWSPSIIIENQIGEGKPHLEALSIRAIGDVTLTRRLESDFRFAKDLSAFPFDAQKLSLSFVSQYYPADDVVFVQDYQDRQMSTLPDALNASDWSARSLTFTAAQFYGWSARPFARLTSEMAIDRKWPRYFLRIFVPFMAVLSVSLFILWSPQGLIGDKTGVTYSALLALAALSFTFEASFPGSMSVTSPIAFMISIGYFYLILALLVDLLLESRNLPGGLAYPYLAQEIRIAVRYLMPFLFVIICICITLRSMA
jgi:Neurotransmitter-gated ion-channel ligand binding domain